VHFARITVYELESANFAMSPTSTFLCDGGSGRLNLILQQVSERSMICKDLYSRSIGRTLADFGFVYMDPTMQGCGLFSKQMKEKKKSKSRLDDTRSCAILYTSICLPSNKQIW